MASLCPHMHLCSWGWHRKCLSFSLHHSPQEGEVLPFAARALCCALLRAGWGGKGFPGMSMGWQNLAHVLGPLFPTCSLQALQQLGESWWVHPHPGDGDGRAGTRRVLLLASHPWVLWSRGAQHPWAMLSHSPPVPVAIEGPMLPSAGLAAQEQQELGSTFLEAVGHERVQTLLPCRAVGALPTS